VKLFEGPQAPVKAWNFAEHLQKTHAFFLPLRTDAQTQCVAPLRVGHCDGVQESFSPSDELKSVSTMFADVDPSPNSRFQHLFARLDRLNREAPCSSIIAAEVHTLLTAILSHIRSSSPTDLSEKIQFGALEVLMRSMRMHHGCDFTMARTGLCIIFQIVESCPDQRHILMQLTHDERETGESLLKYLVKFCSSGSSAAAGADGSSDVAEIVASALTCIKSIVSCSIPYRSLGNFANSGCYGSPKMNSMLTARVLQSILVAIEDEVASEILAFLQYTSNHVDQSATVLLLHLRVDDLNATKFDQIMGLLKPEAAKLFLRMMGCVRRGCAREWSNRDVGAKVIRAFFEDCEDASLHFAGNRSVLRDMIKQDSTVLEFCRLEGAV
jgi:hypothetical protein